MTRFPADVFQTMLEQMFEGTGRVAVAISTYKYEKPLCTLVLLRQSYNEDSPSNSDPLDCGSNNICNLAWLVRDRRHLLDKVIRPTCSNNNRLFYELDVKTSFAGCPRPSGDGV